MDKELKKEIIIKGISKMEDGKFLDFLFGVIAGCNRTKIKRTENKNEK